MTTQHTTTQHTIARRVTAGADNYSKILSSPGGLYQGGALSPQRLTTKFGYRPFLHVACAEECPPDPASAEIVIHLLLDDDARTNWLKIRGWYQDVLRVANEVARVIQDGYDVLVTCHLGLNRSSLIVALALRKLGYSADAAIRYIRARRGPWALSNKRFVEVINAS